MRKNYRYNSLKKIKYFSQHNSHLLPTSPLVSKKRGNIWSMSADWCGSWSICWRQWNVSLIFWKTKSWSVVWWRRDMASCTHLQFAGHLWGQMFLTMLDLLSAPLCYGMKMWFWISSVQSWNATQESLCCSECHRNVPKKKKSTSGWCADNIKFLMDLDEMREPKCNHCHHFTLWLQCKLTYPFFEYGSFKDWESDTIPRAWNPFVALLTNLLQKQTYCLW